jgi:hypothetical protein
MTPPIRIRRAPESAYNPSRPISDLLKSQIEHLLETGRRYRGISDLRVEAAAIRTEGDAAAFVARMTRRLHPEGYVAGETHPLARPGLGAAGVKGEGKKAEGRRKKEEGRKTDERKKAGKKRERRKTAAKKAGRKKAGKNTARPR